MHSSTSLQSNIHHLENQNVIILTCRRYQEMKIKYTFSTSTKNIRETIILNELEN